MGGARFSTHVQTNPGAHRASCTMGTWSFSGVKSDWGVTLTPHAPLEPWSRKSRTIPLLPLWALRPVQSLSACTRVHLTLPYVPCTTSTTTQLEMTVKLVQNLTTIFNRKTSQFTFQARSHTHNVSVDSLDPVSDTMK